MKGQKHLIKCRCFLPQFKNLKSPPVHQFIVFSIIENDVVKVKFSQCNNCGLIHKVIDICKSEILSTKENMSSLIKVEDIRNSLNTNFVNILETNFADIATWEATQFIVENKLWGEFVVLTSEQQEDKIYGKYIRVLSESLCKVETFDRSNGVF